MLLLLLLPLTANTTRVSAPIVTNTCPTTAPNTVTTTGTNMIKNDYCIKKMQGNVLVGVCCFMWDEETWSRKVGLSNIFEAYQISQHCTAVYNRMRQDFTTLESYHSYNHFIFQHNNGNGNQVFQWPTQSLAGWRCVFHAGLMTVWTLAWNCCYCLCNCNHNLTTVHCFLVISVISCSDVVFVPHLLCSL